MEENKSLVVVKDKNKSKKIYINVAIILIIFVALIIYMIKVDGIDNILNLLKNSDYRWVMVGFLCIVIYWICEAICLHIPLKNLLAIKVFLIHLEFL